MVTAFDKAIAGLIVSIVTWFAVHHGLNVDVDTSTYIDAVITGLVVYLVPNKLANTPTS